MDDNLEKYIKSHRSELDNKSPRKELWKDIEKQINVNKINRQRNGTMIYWQAAAVILLLITSWLVFDKVLHNTNETIPEEFAEVNPELKDAEAYYVSLINQKRAEIKELSEKYDLGKGFLIENEKLDSMYVVLKEDMKYGNVGDIVDAMILNLQLRIEILNQQLGIIQSIKMSKEDEKTIL